MFYQTMWVAYESLVQDDCDQDKAVFMSYVVDLKTLRDATSSAITLARLFVIPHVPFVRKMWRFTLSIAITISRRISIEATHCTVATCPQHPLFSLKKLLRLHEISPKPV